MANTIFPPFDPDDEPRRRRFRELRAARVRQLKAIPVRQLLPSVVTLLALCAGLTAIRMSIEARYDYAIAAIAIAALLDAVDGRVARLLKSTSQFGAELDSLTDFVNFGVAPAILLYVWALDEIRSLGWIAVLVYAICVALRLARFNVAMLDPNKPAWQANYFVGIPAPAGAMTVLLPVYVELIGTPHGFWTAPLVLVYAIAVGLLMVSRVPTYSGKLVGRRIPRDMVLPLFVVVVILAALLLSFPWETMAVLVIAYLVSLPLSWRNFEKQAKAEALKAGVDAGKVAPIK
jgi:CDP-diacylglycerol---serine O-phosphatidyltransferase